MNEEVIRMEIKKKNEEIIDMNDMNGWDGWEDLQI